MNSEDIFLVYLIPIPWPPAAETTLYEFQFETIRFSSHVAGGGRIQTRWEWLQNNDSGTFLSQRLVIHGTGFTTLLHSWQNSEYKFYIGGGNPIESESNAPGVIRTVQTDPKIILPEECPLIFSPPSACTEAEKMF